VLFRSSPELVSTQEEYLLALKAGQALGKSPFAEVAASGASLVEAARRRLKLWDISDDQIKALEETGRVKKALTLHSPYGGYVLERNVFKGMSVMPGQALYKLADLSTVWLNLEVYEADLPFIQLGQETTVRLAYLPGEALTGRVIYIYPSLDPKTRAGRVRVELPNPHGRLKPEMYANAEIRIELGSKVVAPEGAIIDTGLRQVAFVDQGGGSFEAREVRLGVKVDNYWEIIAGLSPDERVVTSANFLVDSEAKFKEALSGGAAGAHAGHGK
jgi:Cu(I)/Ag(I) efflux system membrane fusion protein